MKEMWDIEGARVAEPGEHMCRGEHGARVTGVQLVVLC